jgi:hypothetical protein
MRLPHRFAEGAHLLPGELMAAASAKPLTALLHHARGTAPQAVPTLGPTAALGHRVNTIVPLAVHVHIRLQPYEWLK